MSSRNFGWSYPAGCTGPPDDDVIDYPEECPTCDKLNFDEEEDGEWVCPEAKPFCSVECELAYDIQMKEQAEAEAYEQAKHDKLMLEVSDGE